VLCLVTKAPGFGLSRQDFGSRLWTMATFLDLCSPGPTSWRCVGKWLGTVGCRWFEELVLWSTAVVVIICKGLSFLAGGNDLLGPHPYVLNSNVPHKLPHCGQTRAGPHCGPTPDVRSNKRVLCNNKMTKQSDTSV
jgi:hypothetical protein